MRIRHATRPEDRDYIAEVLPKVTVSGYNETDKGWLEAIDDGIVTAVVFEGPTGYRGMALVCLHRAGRDEVSLYVAAAYGEPDATDQEREAVIERIVRMAQHNGCSLLTFNSTRKGWARAASRYGFKTSPYVTYERRLD
jgi:hypothetical protein